MKKYSNITEIIDDFGLSSSAIELDQIKSELKKLLKEHHPDSSKENYNEDLFFKIKEAIEFVKKSKSNTLTNINEYQDIIKAQIQILEINNKYEKKEIIETSNVEIKKRYWIPKISSGIVFIICTSLFSFQNNFSEHPFFRSYYDFSVKKNLNKQLNNWSNAMPDCCNRDYGKFIISDIGNFLEETSNLPIDLRIKSVLLDHLKNSNYSKTSNKPVDKSCALGIEDYFTNLEDRSRKVVNSRIYFLIFILWLLSIVSYILLWTREKFNSNYIKYLLSDIGFKETVRNLVSSKINGNKRFRKFDLKELIKSKNTRKILAAKISEEQQEEVASYLIKKMITKGFVKMVDEEDLDDWYEMSEKIIRKYKN